MLRSGLTLTALLVSSIACGASAPPRVPATLVADGRTPLFKVRGEGVQRYVAREEGSELEWRHEAPDAVLLDYETGEAIGTHAAGPVWIDEDGRRLRGRKVASAPAPDARAVPWLLVETTPAPGGRFADVVAIQRIDTWGGRAPQVPPTRAGERHAVRYEATYVFLGDG